MNHRPNISKVGAIKLLFLLSAIILFVTIGLSGGSNKPEDKLVPAQNEIIESLNDGNKKVKQTKNLLPDSGIYGDEFADSKEIVMCPQYILPILPELPELPSKEVLDSVTGDQLNFILYQHIKAHQDRTVEVRKRIYHSYARYLESCE